MVEPSALSKSGTTGGRDVASIALACTSSRTASFTLRLTPIDDRRGSEASPTKHRTHLFLPQPTHRVVHPLGDPLTPLIRLLSNGCVPYIAHPDLDTPCSCSRHRPQFLTHSPQLWTVRGRVHCACVFTLASRRSPCGYGCSITPSSEMTRSCQATPAYPRRAYRLTIQQYGMETDTGSANPRPGCHRHAMLSLSRLVRSPQGSCMLV